MAVAGTRRGRLVIAIAAAAATTVAPMAGSGTAAAAVPASLKRACVERDALDGEVDNGVRLSFFHCDDGVPAVGGREPNEGALRAVAVPQRYDGVHGLPDAAPAEPSSGADSRGTIALDANLSLPDPRRLRQPRGGYPLVVMMHGCCGGNKFGNEQRTVDAPGTAEGWHYSNAWFASRGYAVLTYTSRGFVSSEGRGSTGVMQLQDRRYEMNDMQSLAGQVADAGYRVGGRRLKVDGTRVVVTGGSYGGGFSWMALTDPTWRSPAGRPMRLAAVAPKYGWTDLVQALVPNGHAGPRPLPPTDGSASAEPLGFPKQTILAGLYATGAGLVPGSHTTFPGSVAEGVACLNSTDPFASNPLCQGTLTRTLREFVEHRSAYFQNRWFRRVRAGDRGAIVPVFSAGAFTDPLFPPPEHRRMGERIRRADPDYPIQEYYGDYQHFVQNKRAEWSDLCGGTTTCEAADYPGYGFDRRPQGFSRLGVTTRLNRFIDHYARPPANRREPRPDNDVTASLQVCPQNASGRFPVDAAGERFSAHRFSALAPRDLVFRLEGAQATTNVALPNPHAKAADPVLNERLNGRHCPLAEGPAGPGVATYTTPALAREEVMIGATRVETAVDGIGSELQLNARLYDVFPDGTAVMVDRGVYRLADSDGRVRFFLHGNGWRFERGHRIRIELAQDDSTYIKPALTPSSLILDGVTLRLPVR